MGNNPDLFVDHVIPGFDVTKNNSGGVSLGTTHVAGRIPSKVVPRPKQSSYASFVTCTSML